MVNGNTTAFPYDVHTQTEGGLTKREYFAAKALQATDLKSYALTHGKKWASEAAKDAVLMADALLLELDKK